MSGPFVLLEPKCDISVSVMNPVKAKVLNVPFIWDSCMMS